MGNENYRKAYETAASELEALLADQEKRENRIMALRKTLNVLSTLCQQDGIDTSDLDQRYARLMQIVEGSVTSDILRIVKSSATALTAPEIREELNKLGGSMAENSNPLATIHAMLNRLVESGKIREDLKDGKKAWIAVREYTPRLRSRFSRTQISKAFGVDSTGKLSDMK